MNVVPPPPRPPPRHEKKMASPLFAVSPGYYSHPKRNRSQLIGKIFDVNKLHYGLCENGELGSSIRNDDDCNENISNKQIRDYFKLLLAVRAVIVHVLDKTSLGRKFHVVVAWRTLRNVPESASFCVCFFLSVLWQIVPTIFIAAQRCNIAATLLRSVTTLFQHCCLKSSRCNLPCVRSPKRGLESFGSSFSLLYVMNEMYDSKEWCNGKSTCLPPMWLRFGILSLLFVVCCNCPIEICCHDNEPGLLRPLL